ncbi:MAG: HNH endonuclease [Carnobacterium sp.]|uniref:HNH endonuclease n=1 Tax=Carnobacterium sp. TaxID=48221 RepID=UPI0033146653
MCIKGGDFIEELEEWRPFGPPYEDITEGYLVSNLGRIMDIKTGRILSQRESSDGLGYYRVQIRNSKLASKLEMVHRLVASAFVEGYQEGMVANHIDCNPSNNRATNLEWLTTKENLNYRSPNTLFKKYKAVYSYTKDDELVRVYAAQEIVKYDNHIPSRVGEVTRGAAHSHHGLKWGVVGDDLWVSTFREIYEDDIDYFTVHW